MTNFESVRGCSISEISCEQVADQRKDLLPRDAATSTRESEIIADNLSEAGWSWGCVATVDREGRTIWVVAAERNAQRFIVHA
jgi:hypothetical protein